MLIAAREHAFLWGRLSGERIYKKDTVMPYARIAQQVGNGVEQVINFAQKNKRVKMILSKNIGHFLKYQRHLPHRAVWYYLKEGWQLVDTQRKLQFKPQEKLNFLHEYTQFKFEELFRKFLQ